MTAKEKAELIKLIKKTAKADPLASEIKKPNYERVDPK